MGGDVNRNISDSERQDVRERDVSSRDAPLGKMKSGGGFGACFTADASFLLTPAHPDAGCSYIICGTVVSALSSRALFSCPLAAIFKRGFVHSATHSKDIYRDIMRANQFIQICPLNC